MSFPPKLGFVFLALMLGACASSDVDPPKNNDNNNNNNGFNNIPIPDMDMAGDTDISETDAGDMDPVHMPGGPFVVGPPRGRDLVVLQGTILGPNGPFEGDVVIQPPLITCVAESCESMVDYAEATVIETGGIISPGLIDSHNHVTYNFLDEWTSPTTFNNRYEWSDDPRYEAHIEPFANNRSSGTHFCPAARWGELRSMINGTTTMMGQSQSQNCIDGMVRNADHEQRLQYDHMRTAIGSVRDINDASAANYIASMDDADDPITRFAVHMAEGTSGNNVELEFSSFAGRDTRNNRHQGVSLLHKETAILIHSLGVTDDELVEARDTNSKIVWSPSSNFVLYGATADIERILELGITVGLGPDWTVSGEDDMPSEMRYALDYARQTGIAALTPRRIWEMSTRDGAEVLGLSDYVGTLEAGKYADITVFDHTMDDPYESVIESRPENIRVVYIGGESYFGEAGARTAVARNEFCEVTDVCGRLKYVCAKDPDADNAFKDLAETEIELYNIMEGIGFPADEQYGRGDEVLPLWSCP